MKRSDFYYDLPPGLIAQRPLEPRDSSRILVLDRNAGTLAHRFFSDLPEYLQAGDTLVFNDTKVFPARLTGVREDTGGKVEVFLLNAAPGGWEALVRPGRRVRPGSVISFGPELSCEVGAVTNFGGRIIRFRHDGALDEVIDRIGETPLPPYIREKLTDPARYQTVYARERGSAAAPTAGLHFTPAIFAALREKGVHCAFITLHVGLGTFRPVSADSVEDHVMHREYYWIPAETAAAVHAARTRGRRVIAVGTTAVRALESAGAGGELEARSGGWTDIFIYPGYRFRLIDGLITNFHLPESTLLMLVSALAGRERVMAAYQEAIREQYRFFSFGDAMLII